MRLTVAALTLALSIPGVALAEEASCEELLDRARDDMSLGVSGGSARVELTIVGRRGDERRRTLEVKSAKEDGQLRTVVRMLAPADVAGTAFLMRENADGPDEQVLYLPALGRTRRITGAARKGSFMGTDFSYEDLEVRGADESLCSRLADETLDGQAVYVLESRPKAPEKDDAYGRARLWVHQKTMVPLKVELYDRKDQLLKVMKVHQLQKKAGRWLATETTMENTQKGTSTRLVLAEVDPDATFPPETFTERSLER